MFSDEKKILGEVRISGRIVKTLSERFIIIQCIDCNTSDEENAYFEPAKFYNPTAFSNLADVLEAVV